MRRLTARLPVRTSLLVALLMACGGGGTSPNPNPPPPPPPPPPAPAPVASVSVSPGTASLLPPATQQLAATTKDATGNVLNGRAVSWSSGTPAVASVSGTGLVTSLSTGTAVITATSEGVSGTATITVVAPVATVTLDKTTATLVPTQTLQLAATMKDAAGVVLTDRAVAWSTSAASVVTVSGTGLLTAVASGNATITATSEGKTATAAILVADGTVVGSGGGTVVALNGAVKINVPAGAAPAGTAFAVEPVSQQPAPSPSYAEPFGGAFYKFSPEGMHFATPVTVTLKYDPSLLAWAAQSDITMLRWDGTAWSKLTNIVIDSSAHTVSGQTPGFSTIAVARQFISFPVKISPTVPAVNVQARSITLTARDASNITRSLANFAFKWTTTGKNGVLNSQFGDKIQYTETAVTLPNGIIDQVTVEVYPPGSLGFGLIGTATVDITGDAQWFVTLNPPGAQIKLGQVMSFDVDVRDLNGNPYPTPNTLHYAWLNSHVTGTWSFLNTMNHIFHITYTAFNGTQAATSPPRGEKIYVDVYEDQVKWDFSVFPPTSTTKMVLLGSATQFIEIGNNQYVGFFMIREVPTPNGACVYADVMIPKVIPASKYVVWLRGFNDPLGMYTSPFPFQFTGATGTGIGKVEDIIVGWRYPLDGSCVSSAAIASRRQILTSRFAGMYIEVDVTP